MKNIAVIAKTRGLEFDDRIRKECIALSKKYHVTIFVVFDDNRQEEGITSYGIKYKSFRIKTRDILPQSKFLLIKAFEYYLKVIVHLKEFDLFWAHEEYTFLFPLLAKKNKCIWDLHETPDKFNNYLMRKVFHYIEKKSYKIIHANNYRINHLKKIHIIKDLKKHTYLNNFPDLKFLQSTKENSNYQQFQNWLDGSNYIYLQGLSFVGRYPINTIESVIETNSKAVVVGEIESGSLKYLNKKHPNLDSFIYFTGMVNQLEITKYIINSQLTIIMYDSSSANELYCEPNRLYQSIGLNKPVITGNNPPMKDIVEKYGLGLSLENDGSKKSEIIEAIEELNESYDLYKKNLLKHSKKFIWQDRNVYEIL